MPKRTESIYLVLLAIFWLVNCTLLLAALTILAGVEDGWPSGSALLALVCLAGGVGGLAFAGLALRRRELPASRKERLQRYRSLYLNAPALLHTIDANGVVTEASEAWLDCFGYSRNAVIGRSFFEFIVTDDPASLKNRHLRHLAKHGGMSDMPYTLRKGDGSEVEITLTEIVRKNADGKPEESMAAARVVTNASATAKTIEQLAYYDTLTGLPNRILLHDRMIQSISQARRDSRQIGVFFFDLDRFKTINDTQGHASGDLVLRAVAQRLKKIIREGDTFARLAGDEFVIIQADPNHDPDFTTMARRICETLREPFHLADRQLYASASIGVAIYPSDGGDPQALLKSADTAMYVAKSCGRNNYQFFSDEMNAAEAAKSSLENKLRHALTSGELKQHYQAQVDLASGKIIGVEALLRWQDDQANFIPAREVISVAEKSGLIYPLGEWSLKTACWQAKDWLNKGLPIERVSVNLSGHHIRQSNFIDQIEAVLDETGLPPEKLEIELAENSVMGHVNDIIMALTDLKVRGIHLTIDDFGSGYSSLLYLMHFPVHRIKITPDFITEIDRRPDYLTIVQAIIAMAQSLHLKVCAVGVETTHQINRLITNNCLEAQGNYFYPVMNPESMATLLSHPNLFPGAAFRRSHLQTDRGWPPRDLH